MMEQNKKNLILNQRTKILRGSEFQRCTVFGEMKFCSVEDSKFFHVLFKGCNLRESIFDRCLFEKCTFQNCYLTGASLKSTIFSKCHFVNTPLIKCSLIGTDLRTSDSNGFFSLEGSEIEGCLFNFECKPFIGEYLAIQAIKDGGPERNDRLAWSLFIARDRTMCREHFWAVPFPEHLKQWGFCKLMKLLESGDHAINPESRRAIETNFVKLTQ